MRISRVPRLATLLTWTLIAAACGSDESDPAGPIPADLAGTWTASGTCSACEFTFRSVAQPSLQLDMVAIGGQVRIEIRRSGTYEFFASMAGQSISRLGIVEINSNTLRFKDSATGAVDTATYSVSGNLLTLDFQSVLQDFDIDDDGNPDPVRAYAVLRRN
ncbi:MAG TPA: hypothetical protein VKZ58_08715 [Longimicrobiales bacterium]|nr:hypothetical protein [Longimicrobiales bacterium]